MHAWKDTIDLDETHIGIGTDPFHTTCMPPTQCFKWFAKKSQALRCACLLTVETILALTESSPAESARLRQLDSSFELS